MRFRAIGPGSASVRVVELESGHPSPFHVPTTPASDAKRTATIRLSRGFGRTRGKHCLTDASDCGADGSDILSQTADAVWDAAIANVLQKLRRSAPKVALTELCQSILLCEQPMLDAARCRLADDFSDLWAAEDNVLTAISAHTSVSPMPAALPSTTVWRAWSRGLAAGTHSIAHGTNSGPDGDRRDDAHAVEDVVPFQPTDEESSHASSIASSALALPCVYTSARAASALLVGLDVDMVQAVGLAGARAVASLLGEAEPWPTVAVGSTDEAPAPSKDDHCPAPLEPPVTCRLVARQGSATANSMTGGRAGLGRYPGLLPLHMASVIVETSVGLRASHGRLVVGADTVQVHGAGLMMPEFPLVPTDTDDDDNNTRMAGQEGGHGGPPILPGGGADKHGHMRGSSSVNVPGDSGLHGHLGSRRGDATMGNGLHGEGNNGESAPSSSDNTAPRPLLAVRKHKRARMTDPTALGEDQLGHDGSAVDNVRLQDHTHAHAHIDAHAHGTTALLLPGTMEHDVMTRSLRLHALLMGSGMGLGLGSAMGMDEGQEEMEGHAGRRPSKRQRMPLPGQHVAVPTVAQATLTDELLGIQRVRASTVGHTTGHGSVAIDQDGTVTASHMLTVGPTELDGPGLQAMDAHATAAQPMSRAMAAWSCISSGSTTAPSTATALPTTWLWHTPALLLTDGLKAMVQPVVDQDAPKPIATKTGLLPARAAGTAISRVSTILRAGTSAHARHGTGTAATLVLDAGVTGGQWHGPLVAGDISSVASTRCGSLPLHVPVMAVSVAVARAHAAESGGQLKADGRAMHLSDLYSSLHALLSREGTTWTLSCGPSLCAPPHLVSGRAIDQWARHVEDRAGREEDKAGQDDAMKGVAAPASGADAALQHADHTPEKAPAGDTTGQPQLTVDPGAEAGAGHAQRAAAAVVAATMEEDMASADSAGEPAPSAGSGATPADSPDRPDRPADAGPLGGIEGTGHGAAPRTSDVSMGNAEGSDQDEPVPTAGAPAATAAAGATAAAIASNIAHPSTWPSIALAAAQEAAAILEAQGLLPIVGKRTGASDGAATAGGPIPLLPPAVAMSRLAAWPRDINQQLKQPVTSSYTSARQAYDAKRRAAKGAVKAATQAQAQASSNTSAPSLQSAAVSALSEVKLAEACLRSAQTAVAAYDILSCLAQLPGKGQDERVEYMTRMAGSAHLRQQMDNGSVPQGLVQALRLGQQRDHDAEHTAATAANEAAVLPPSLPATWTGVLDGLLWMMGQPQGRIQDIQGPVEAEAVVVVEGQTADAPAPAPEPAAVPVAAPAQLPCGDPRPADETESLAPKPTASLQGGVSNGHSMAPVVIAQVHATATGHDDVDSGAMAVDVDQSGHCSGSDGVEVAEQREGQGRQAAGAAMEGNGRDEPDHQPTEPQPAPVILPTTPQTLLASFKAGQLALRDGVPVVIPPGQAVPLALPVMVSEDLLQDGAVLDALRVPLPRGPGLQLVERLLPRPVDLVLDDSTAVAVLRLRDVLVEEGRAQGSSSNGPAARPSAPTLAPTDKWREFIRGLAAQAPRFGRVHVVVDLRHCSGDGTGQAGAKGSSKGSSLAAQHKIWAAAQDALLEGPDDDDATGHGAEGGSSTSLSSLVASVPQEPLNLCQAATYVLHRAAMATINFAVPVTWHSAGSAQGLAAVVGGLVHARMQSVAVQAARAVQTAATAPDQANPASDPAQTSSLAGLTSLHTWADREWMTPTEDEVETFTTCLGLNPFTSARVSAWFPSPAMFMTSNRDVLARVLGRDVPGRVVEQVHALCTAGVAMPVDAQQQASHSGQAKRQGMAGHTGGVGSATLYQHPSPAYVGMVSPPGPKAGKPRAGRGDASAQLGEGYGQYGQYGHGAHGHPSAPLGKPYDSTAGGQAYHGHGTDEAHMEDGDGAGGQHGYHQYGQPQWEQYSADAHAHHTDRPDGNCQQDDRGSDSWPDHRSQHSAHVERVDPMRRQAEQYPMASAQQYELPFQQQGRPAGQLPWQPQQQAQAASFSHSSRDDDDDGQSFSLARAGVGRHGYAEGHGHGSGGGARDRSPSSFSLAGLRRAGAEVQDRGMAGPSLPPLPSPTKSMSGFSLSGLSTSGFTAGGFTTGGFSLAGAGLGGAAMLGPQTGMHGHGGHAMLGIGIANTARGDGGFKLASRASAAYEAPPTFSLDGAAVQGQAMPPPPLPFNSSGGAGGHGASRFTGQVRPYGQPNNGFLGMPRPAAAAPGVVHIRDPTAARFGMRGLTTGSAVKAARGGEGTGMGW